MLNIPREKQFPSLLSIRQDLMGYWRKKHRIQFSYVTAVLCVPPLQRKGGTRTTRCLSAFSSQFSWTVVRAAQKDRDPQTPAAAVAAQGSSPYLIQFVNAGADRSELAVWDTTNRKHPIKDAPIVDLGEREQVISYELKHASAVSSFSPLQF